MPLPTSIPGSGDEDRSKIVPPPTFTPSLARAEQAEEIPETYTPSLIAPPNAEDIEELYEETDEEEEIVAPPVPQTSRLTVGPPTTVQTPSNQVVEKPVAEYIEIDDDYNSHEEMEEERRKATINSLSDDAKQNARRLLQLISSDESSEVLLNGPTAIMYKKGGQRFVAENIKFEDIETYHKVINALILHETDTADRIGTTSHLIEAQLEMPDYDNPDSLPLFARVHAIVPPVVKAAKVTIAKKAKNQFGIDQLAQRGSMNQQMASFLKAIARGRATVVFSGLSGSGKTTLLEAMSHHFDENDRLVVAEDTAELRLPLPDVVPLLATSRKPGQDKEEIVTLEWLVAQANRMRPDRIIVGEVRSGEMAEFLTAANSGADGSMTTVHASSPKQTIDKMVSLAMKSPTSGDRSSILRDISSTVQIIVQTALIDGRHIISQIEEVSDTVTGQGTSIATTPIFTFDRNTGQFASTGRPSDKLTNFLAQRGVNVEPAWFTRGH